MAPATVCVVHVVVGLSDGGARNRTGPHNRAADGDRTAVTVSRPFGRNAQRAHAPRKRNGKSCHDDGHTEWRFVSRTTETRNCVLSFIGCDYHYTIYRLWVLKNLARVRPRGACATRGCRTRRHFVVVRPKREFFRVDRSPIFLFSMLRTSELFFFWKPNTCTACVMRKNKLQKM